MPDGMTGADLGLAGVVIYLLIDRGVNLLKWFASRKNGSNNSAKSVAQTGDSDRFVPRTECELVREGLKESLTKIDKELEQVDSKLDKLTDTMLGLRLKSEGD